MLVSFCIQIYKVRPNTDLQCIRKIKGQETGTSVFKTLTIYSKKKALTIYTLSVTKPLILLKIICSPKG